MSLTVLGLLVSLLAFGWGLGVGQMFSEKRPRFWPVVLMWSCALVWGLLFAEFVKRSS